MKTIRTRLWPAPAYRLIPALVISLSGSVTNAFARSEELGASGRPMSAELGAAVWTTAQVIPSPLLVMGAHRIGAGVRWQVTPLLYSFGVASRPFRFFYIEPVARHTGAVELYGSPEWTCCAGADGAGWQARAGTRLYLPVIGRGESGCVSIGGSYVYEKRRHHGAVEFGVYTLSSIVGLTVTVAPWRTERTVIVAFALHYF